MPDAEANELLIEVREETCEESYTEEYTDGDWCAKLVV